MSYFKRPESRSKIFDKRSKSMRSGTFSVNDASEQRDTITTE